MRQWEEKTKSIQSDFYDHLKAKFGIGHTGVSNSGITRTPLFAAYWITV